MTAGATTTAGTAAGHYWTVTLNPPPGSSAALVNFVAMARTDLQLNVDLLGHGVPELPPSVNDLLTTPVFDDLGQGAASDSYKKALADVRARQSTLQNLDDQVAQTSSQAAASNDQTLAGIRDDVAQLQEVLAVNLSGLSTKARQATEVKIMSRIADTLNSVCERVSAVADYHNALAGGGSGATTAAAGSGATTAGDSATTTAGTTGTDATGTDTSGTDATGTSGTGTASTTGDTTGTGTGLDMGSILSQLAPIGLTVGAAAVAGLAPIATQFIEGKIQEHQQQTEQQNLQAQLQAQQNSDTPGATGPPPNGAPGGSVPGTPGAPAGAGPALPGAGTPGPAPGPAPAPAGSAGAGPIAPGPVPNVVLAKPTVVSPAPAPTPPTAPAPGPATTKPAPAAPSTGAAPAAPPATT